MRTLIFLAGLYLMHRLVLSMSPTYRVRMQRLDRKVTWLNIMLVTYLAANFLIRLLRYMNQEE